MLFLAPFILPPDSVVLVFVFGDHLISSHNFLYVNVLASSFHIIQPELKGTQQQQMIKKGSGRTVLFSSGSTGVFSRAITRFANITVASRDATLIDLFVIPFAVFYLNLYTMGVQCQLAADSWQ